MPTHTLFAPGLEQLFTTEYFPEGSGPRERPISVEANVRTTSVTRSGTNAIPLSLLDHGKADKDGFDTVYDGYDRGHLIALNLGGPNVSANVVPMVAHQNRRGRWKEFERAIKKEANGKNVTIKIRISYDSKIDTIPSQFEVSVFKAGKELDLGLKNKPILNCSKNIKVSTITPHVRSMFEKAEAEIDVLVQKYKDGVVKFKDNPSGFIKYVAEEKLVVHHGGFTERFTSRGYGLDLVGTRWPARGRCPYAILDYLYLRERLAKELNKWSGMFEPFGKYQRELIWQYSAYKSKGFIVSDDEEDRKLFPMLNPRGALNFPEIDHIIPNSRGGSNAFSNARIISWHHNNRVDRIKDPEPHLVMFPDDTPIAAIAAPVSKRKEGVRGEDAPVVALSKKRRPN